MAITLNEPYIQPLPESWYQPYVSSISILRLDVLHPVISGNKWYKLKYNVQQAQQHGYDTILTFGGGYSNHLVATAAAAYEARLRSIGFVRGVYDVPTPTLQACEEYGMQLIPISQEEYKLKTDVAWLQELQHKYPNALIVPEGGANEWGRAGAATIAEYISDTYTHICTSVGTGTTFIGLRNTLPADAEVWGYVPMKGGIYLKDELQQYLNAEKNTNWQLFDDWHFGGFGKVSNELIAFMNAFYQATHIPLDMVYTGKMLYGIQQQLRQGAFPRAANILCVHTGGLQGNASVKDKLAY
jgi:1-aminocyclopropane-1-carboxylate deaminase